MKKMPDARCRRLEKPPASSIQHPASSIFSEEGNYD
jgi:hypothetical protein